MPSHTQRINNDPSCCVLQYRDTEIQECVRRCVPSATRYKDEWASRAFETWRSKREKIALRDKSIRCVKTPLENMSAEELNESMAHFVSEVKKQDSQEYPANSLHGLVCAIQRYLKTQCGKNFHFFNDGMFNKLQSFSEVLGHMAQNPLI